ncbi:MULTISPECIES: cysteine desulfurase DndA [Kordiimonas]|jgi:cysteine desulfurase|uniref:cysteine desulfurase DndA n=1 Tax=Kordiimonas TaxID=288021 RepID=UPI002579EB90|nr:cysteine desulfurase DndA [Kordiimonas sp. UBA4487]
MTIYLDCNATTPLEPRVQETITRWFCEEVGNSGSRTHEFGLRAKHTVDTARQQVASVVSAKPDEVIFTSGATEANNIAILGLAAHGEATGKKHIVSTAIEHKAILEPLEHLAERGFEITLIKPNENCLIDPVEVKAAVRSDTLLVSVMHVNNETGVRQPLAEICDLLRHEDVYIHTDAAQGFGKVIDDLTDPRIDLISVTSHKIYGPIGVGSLIARRRKYKRVPLTPLTYGGGQERGLRPGTLPVPLIVGFGLASEICAQEFNSRNRVNAQIRRAFIDSLNGIPYVVNGDEDCTLPHVLNISISNTDSEAVMLALKGIAAISNGSACTSNEYSPSHVLQAMGADTEGAVRISWCHLTPPSDWLSVGKKIKVLTGGK